jgi:hypothetical protein
MGDREGEGAGHRRLLVDEVDFHPVDHRLELRQPVQRPFLGPPVEAVFPVGDE